MLLQIAVAEVIYGWEYVGDNLFGPNNWKTPQSTRDSVREADPIRLLELMMERHKLHAKIHTPWRKTGHWTVELKNHRGGYFQHSGKTMLEAVSRASLLVHGVEVDV